MKTVILKNGVGNPEGFIRTKELAQAYLAQGSTVKAAATMLNLIKTEPTPENLALLADIYMEQGLFEDAKELYLRVVKAGLNGTSPKKS